MKGNFGECNWTSTSEYTEVFTDNPCITMEVLLKFLCNIWVTVLQFSWSNLNLTTVMKRSDFPPRVILTNSLSGLDGQIYWGLSYWGQRWRIYLCSVLSSVVCIYNLRLNATQDVQLWLHKAITLIPLKTFFLTSCLPYQAVGDCFNLLGIVFHTKSDHQPKTVLGNLKCVML